MRVCFLFLDVVWDGHARAFVEAGREMRARGVEVVMVCPARSQVSRIVRDAGFDAVEIAVRGRWLTDAWRLRGVLKQTLSDVVFVHGERAQLVASVAIRSVGRGAVVRRNPPRAHLADGRAARFGARLARTGMLFASEEDRRTAQLSLRLIDAGVAVSAAPDVMSPRVPTGAVVTCVFDRDTRGALLPALRALALVAPRHPELRIVLTGPTGDDDALRIQVAALGIGSAVSLTDEPAERAIAVSGARVVWILADGDDFGFAALDAFAAGVPVLASRTPLAARYVTDGVNGIALTATEPANAASTIVRLLADDSVHSQLATGARATAAHWPRAAMAEGYERAAAAVRNS